MRYGKYNLYTNLYLFYLSVYIDLKKLLKVIGYKEIMNIKEDYVVYEKDVFQLAIKDIKKVIKACTVRTI